MSSNLLFHRVYLHWHIFLKSQSCIGRPLFTWRAAYNYNCIFFQCRKYRRKFSEAEKYKMKEKLMASELFKDKKEGYAKT